MEELNKKSMIGMMTFHTYRFLTGDYEFENKKKYFTSGDQIKELLVNKYKGKFENDQAEINFNKGLALCDFKVVFEKACVERGFHFSPDSLALEVLKSLYVKN